MEFEQIGKRLEWLDEQQRRNKSDLVNLGERLTSIETSVNALTQQFKTLSQGLAEIAPATARINLFDQMMTKQRTDLGKMVESTEKNTIRREQELSKLYHTELETLRKTITQLGRTIDPEDIYEKLKAHTREEQRLNLGLKDVLASVETVAAQSKEILLAQKAMEEPRRQDAKRLADLQGEIASVRKRADDVREKTTLHADSIRNLENRISELLETETGRREEQATFLAQQAMVLVDRDRGWKEWQEQYEVFKDQAKNMDVQVVALDDSIRAAKRAQDTYNDLNQKLERRIAEVGEMQRLAEDRIRQEWVSFKAEEQKRWTSHSLSQEEAMRDLRKNMDKLEHRATALDDAAQTLQDQLQQTTETTEKQMQELMNVANEWLVSYERIMGHGKKTKKAAR
jgi:chromosome segregation ATPase